MKNAVISAVLIGFAGSTCLGCASIVSGRRADVSIDSYPANARVTVRDDDGKAVASLNTPGVVALQRNRKYFLPARYTATIESPGFQPAQVPITSTMNPWILGNIVFGGIPGLVVDNATGAAWKPCQQEIHRQLIPLDGPEHARATELPPHP